MATHLSILGSNSTKGNIIELLSNKWPLTARKIYKKLARDYALSITYQAVHKALKELTENKVLDKRKQGYLLNKEWIKQLGNFSEKMKDELENLGQKREVKTIHKLIFNEHREFIKFHLDFVEATIEKEKELEMIFHFRHVPYPHVLSNEELKRMKQLMPKMKWSILSKKSTPMGKWCAKQWRKMGVRVKLGADISADRMMILNDYIINLYTTREAISKWDKAYSVKSINDFNINLIAESISNPKYKTIITIIKDKEIASLLK